MNQVNQPRLAHLMPAGEESGGDPPDVLSTADVSSLAVADGFPE